jgi:hypothetical protein
MPAFAEMQMATMISAHRRTASLLSRGYISAAISPRLYLRGYMISAHRAKAESARLIASS